VVKSVAPLPGPTLQILPRRVRRKKTGSGGVQMQEKQREKTTKPVEKSLTRKMRHVGPPWICSASFSAQLS
jgi:hypothetical protein